MGSTFMTYNDVVVYIDWGSRGIGIGVGDGGWGMGGYICRGWDGGDMLWVCDRCAREGKRDYVCMTTRDEGRPPSKGSSTLRDGQVMRCDRCEWVRADEMD